MVVKVVGSESNTVTQFLHNVSELSALYISKTCLKDLNFPSNSTPIPENTRLPNQVHSP